MAVLDYVWSLVPGDRSGALSTCVIPNKRKKRKRQIVDSGHFRTNSILIGTTINSAKSNQQHVDKGSEWILSVARHRDPMADPVGTLRNAEKC